MASAEDHIVSDEERPVIEHLLRERLALRGICRAVGDSLTGRLRFMVERFASYPDQLYVQLPVDPTGVVIQRIAAEADEMWSFGGKKANTPWSWMAMEAKTRQVLAFHRGDRSRESGESLWAKIPAVDQQQATFYTDLYEVYKGVIPPTQAKAMTKKARKTHHVERFNNTLRHRISRLVRDTLSFSKKLANHSGAITFVICHDNLAKAAALLV